MILYYILVPFAWLLWHIGFRIHVDELMISRIPGKHEGETYFPSFDEYNFQLEKETQMETFVLQIYKKG